MVGGMGVKKNIHIENWAGFRENCEHVFKFSRGAWAKFAIFGVAVPVVMYRAIVGEMETPGHAVGRGPERLGLERYYMWGQVGRGSRPGTAKDSAEEE